jgi:protein involved in ribonucleotide reduction
VVYYPQKQVEERSATLSFLAVDKPNIVLSALYSEGDKIYARFYERSGKATNASIDLPYLKKTELNKVKLNGDQVQKIQNVDGKVKLDFKPWEIVTLSFPVR